MEIEVEADSLDVCNCFHHFHDNQQMCGLTRIDSHTVSLESDQFTSKTNVDAAEKNLFS